MLWQPWFNQLLRDCAIFSYSLPQSRSDGGRNATWRKPRRAKKKQTRGHDGRRHK